MSKYLYKVPKDFDLICSNNNLFLKHKLGEVSLNHYRIGFKKINLKTKLIFLKSKKFFGFKKLINNEIKGFLRGFKYELIIFGLGYKIQVKDNLIYFYFGLSHPIIKVIPKDIEIFLETEKKFIIYGINYEQVTNFVYSILKMFPINKYTKHGITFKKKK